MSQTGAKGLALHGYSAREILRHYYTGTDIGHWRRPLGQRFTAGGAAERGLRRRTHAGPRRLRIHTTYIATTTKDGQIGSKASTVTCSPTCRRRSRSRARDRSPSTEADQRSDRRALPRQPADHAGSGGLDVINRVGLESYVRGVVPAESPRPGRRELEAQAIAAQLRDHEHAAGRLRSLLDTRSQEYGGYDSETPATNAAVEATIGQVVTYGGAPVTTYYFASSGGETENVENALAGKTPEPYLTAVLDPYDGSRFGRSR